MSHKKLNADDTDLSGLARILEALMLPIADYMHFTLLYLMVLHEAANSHSFTHLALRISNVLRQAAHLSFPQFRHFIHRCYPQNGEYGGSYPQGHPRRFNSGLIIRAAVLRRRLSHLCCAVATISWFLRPGMRVTGSLGSRWLREWVTTNSAESHK